MASKNTELRREQAEKKRIAFVKAIEAVENEHGMQIVPMIQYTDQGLYPTLASRDRVIAHKEEKKVI